jgi:hypothetical protein
MPHPTASQSEHPALSVQRSHHAQARTTGRHVRRESAKRVSASSSSGSVCTSDTTPVLHGCVAQVTQVRPAAIPEIDPRLKCKTVRLYGFYFQAIDSKWDILEDRKILRFRSSFVRRSRVGKLGVSIRSRAAAKQPDQRSPRDRFLSCGVSPGGRFRKLTHYQGSGDGHPFAQFACGRARMTPQRRIALPIASSRIDECVRSK